MNKVIKKFVALFLCCMLLCTTDLIVFADTANGWVLEGSKWTYVENGAKVKNQWRESAGRQYYLGEDGYPVADAIIVDNEVWDEDELPSKGNVYCTNSDGSRYVGWLLSEQSSSEDPTEQAWYYFDSEGKIAKDGWKLINGLWYYFNDEGVMHSADFIEDGNKIYFVSQSGAMTTGWHQLTEYEAEALGMDEDAWIYSDSHGAVFDDDDVKKIGEKYCYFGLIPNTDLPWDVDSESKELTQFQLITEAFLADDDGDVVYVDEDGYLVKKDTITVKDNGTKYSFYADGDGKLVTGVVKVSGKWAYYNANYTYNKDAKYVAEIDGDKFVVLNIDSAKDAEALIEKDVYEKIYKIGSSKVFK